MALNVTDPWFVSDVNFDEKDKRLDIHIDFKRGSAFGYVDSKTQEEFARLKAYDTQKKTWRHLNFFEHECYLHARVPRVKLPNGRVKLVSTPWEGLSNGFTLLFEALALQLAQAMPVNQVARIIGTSDDKLWSMLERYIDRTRNEENFEGIEAIGMDETSRAKGHEYITLFVDMCKHRTLFVTEGKGNLTVARFAYDFQQHHGSIEKIKDVSCDMSPAFIKGVSENLPHAQITFDKFHILKSINAAVDAVRRQEASTSVLLKGTKYLWLKNEKNLTAKQQERLHSLVMSRMNLKTLRAYRIRQAFQDIYQAQTKEASVTYLKKWYFWATHSRLQPVIEAAKTIKRHWEGVIQWHTSKINNGILEGLNSVIQAAKSKARGYKTFKNYKMIAYLLTGKLDFSSINPALKRI